MISYLDFVYTSDGKFGIVLAFNKTLHKYKVAFNYTKSNETTDLYYREDLRTVV